MENVREYWRKLRIVQKSLTAQQKIFEIVTKKRFAIL